MQAHSNVTHSYVYSQSQVGWNFRKLFQSSKLKARTSLFTETWQKRRSSSKLSALKELSKMSSHLGLVVPTWSSFKRNSCIGVPTWRSHVCLHAHTLHEAHHVQCYSTHQKKSHRSTSNQSSKSCTVPVPIKKKVRLIMYIHVCLQAHTLHEWGKSWGMYMKLNEVCTWMRCVCMNAVCHVCASSGYLMTCLSYDMP